MKTRKTILCVFAVILTLAFIACDTGGGGLDSKTPGDPASVTYTGTLENVVYTLKITGDSYELTGGEKKSTGKVTSNTGGVFGLQPSLEGASAFTVTVSENEITGITGNTTWDDGTPFTDPGTDPGTGPGTGPGIGTAPTITTASLPGGTVGTAYSQTLLATGSTPITWSLASGALPAGLTLAPTGAISGTPAAVGTSSFTVRAANAAGSRIRALSIVIAPSGGTPHTHTVTFNSNGGSTVPVQTVAGGGHASEPQNVTKDGYTLAGWFRDDNTFQNQWDFATDTVSGDITLYAKWVEVSADPTNWTAVANSTFGTSHIYAIAYGNNTWVAVGISGKMAYSTDNGITWTAVSNSTFSIFDPILAIAYANGRFVAVGAYGKMAYSTDGASWTALTDSTFGTTDIQAIAYGNGRFVAGGAEGKMAYSTDNGITWTAVADSTFGTTQINAIAYANGRFVAVGAEGKMAYSTDGVTWTAVTNSTFGTSYIICAIAYGNGRWVAVGDGEWSDGVAYSDDGITWTAVMGFTIYPINAIAYANNRFVAGGDQGRMGCSAKAGEGWFFMLPDSSTFGTTTIMGIAYGNNRFVAVGFSGRMAYCDW